ncbi:hypothetical protein D7147_08105 [Micromonospora musae]|uniref:Uncharacterized protein n=1 Tax=Micromonospora musae TaxID=1894970 RepID=A0ABX9RGK6_9ACTN|nr:hypothetical protein [Micromonospora musae]RKN22598.1 hypothetical protein D7147_08105 [Micromonospora musae]
MDDLSAAGLAAAASAALIQAMVSDVWLGMKDRAARVLGREKTGATVRLDRALEESRERVLSAAQDHRDQASALETARWAGWLQARLDDDASFADAVRDLVAAIEESGVAGDRSTTVRQNITAGRDAYTAGRDLTVGRPDAAP